MAASKAPANQGICVKNEIEDHEIEAMALQMKENYKNIAEANLLRAQNTRASANPVSAITATNSSLNSEELNTTMDAQSEMGRFGWHTIGAHHVPYIIRVINGKHLKFVSVRMAETYLLRDYIHYLNVEMYSLCTSVKAHLITIREAKHLTDINKTHCYQLYGKEDFVTDKDYIAHLDDVNEFYLFIEFCYKRLTNTYIPGNSEICGFIRIEPASVLPYCVIDNKKYLPFFFFDEEPGDIRPPTIEIENWKLAYLKFCCIVQGVQDELFNKPSCLVISLDNIKCCFQTNTHFEDFWPTELVVGKELLTIQAFGHTNPPGSWINSLIVDLNKESISNNIVQHSNPLSAGLSPSMPMGINSNQNGRLSNHLVNLYATRVPIPTHHDNVPSRSQKFVSQYYNKKSVMLKPSSLNNTMNIQLPPLVQSGTQMTQIVRNRVAYPYIASTSQSMKMLVNSIPNHNMISSQHQPIVQQHSLNSGQMQCHQQQLKQQPHVQTTMTSERAVRIINTQRRNLSSTTPMDLIDLSSPSTTSPGPQATLLPETHSQCGFIFKRVPEYVSQPGSSHSK